MSVKCYFEDVRTTVGISFITLNNCIVALRNMFSKSHVRSKEVQVNMNMFGVETQRAPAHESLDC
jgi:hypothetical protein